jgi:hypothetical protein
MKKLKGFKYGLMKHLSDATSVSSFSVPLKAVTDQLAGISDLESLESRAKMTALNYLGLVQLLKIRDYTKRKLGISRSKNKALHYIHDIGFVMAVGIPIQTAVYISSGVNDWKEIAMTMGASIGITTCFAGPLGQYVDSVRELLRIKKSKNTPAFIKRIKNSSKKKVAAGLIAGSVALTGLLYSAIPNRDSEVQYQENSKIEQMIEDENTDRDTIYSMPLEAEN